jgi:hypothetical protein
VPKFRKKPIEIEAEQWFPGKDVPGVMLEEYEDAQSIGTCREYYVVTAHKQRVVLSRGDWVIPEPDGRGHYPVKDDIFRATYDPVC